MTALLALIRWGAGFLLIAWLFAADGAAQQSQPENAAHEVTVHTGYVRGRGNAWDLGTSIRLRAWRRLSVESEFAYYYAPYTDRAGVKRSDRVTSFFVTGVYDFGDYRNGTTSYVRGGIGSFFDNDLIPAYRIGLGVRVPVSRRVFFSSEFQSDITLDGSYVPAVIVGFGYGF